MTTPNAGKVVEQPELAYIADGNMKIVHELQKIVSNKKTQTYI